MWFQTKSDTSLWRMPAKFGCQTHFSGFNKTFLILKKEQTFPLNQEWEDGKVSQNTCSKPLCPCFSERRRPLQVFPSTSGFSDLWKTLLQYSGLPDGGLIIKMITIMRMTRWKNYNYNIMMIIIIMQHPCLPGGCLLHASSALPSWPADLSPQCCQL